MKHIYYVKQFIKQIKALEIKTFTIEELKLNHNIEIPSFYLTTARIRKWIRITGRKTNYYKNSRNMINIWEVV
jgi:hypothetical protein